MSDDEVDVFVPSYESKSVRYSPPKRLQLKNQCPLSLPVVRDSNHKLLNSRQATMDAQLAFAAKSNILENKLQKSLRRLKTMKANPRKRRAETEEKDTLVNITESPPDTSLSSEEPVMIKVGSTWDENSPEALIDQREELIGQTIKSDSVRIKGIKFFGWEIDRITLMSYVIGLGVLTMLWYSIDLFNPRESPHRQWHTTAVYILGCMLFLEEIFGATPTVQHPVDEMNTLVFQTEHVLALLGPLVFIMIGHSFLPWKTNLHQRRIFAAMFFLILMSMFFEAGDGGSKDFKTIRVFKQAMYNIVILLGIAYVILIDF